MLIDCMYKLLILKCSPKHRKNLNNPKPTVVKTIVPLQPFWNRKKCPFQAWKVPLLKRNAFL